MATAAFKVTTTRTPIGASPYADDSGTSASSAKAHRRSRSLSRFSRRVLESESDTAEPPSKGKFANTVRGSGFPEISLDDLAIEFSSVKDEREDGRESARGRSKRRRSSGNSSHGLAPTESSTAAELPKPTSYVKKQKLDPPTVVSPTPLEVPNSTVAAATTSTDLVPHENHEEEVYIPPKLPPENPPQSFLFTWRNHDPNILPDASFSQGESNSCSYVTAVRVCDTAIAKEKGIVPGTSSQTLIDNMETYYPEACIARHERAPPSEVWSSRVRHSMRYLKERGAGINTPYVGYIQIPPPEHPPRGHILTIRGFEVFEVKDCENAAEIESEDIIEVPVGGGDIIPALIREGPIAGEMYGYLKSFNAYRGGVYEGKKPPKLGKGNMRIGHAMLITGYGRTRRGVEYYECQNSYGNTWGDMGYCRVKRSLFWGFCVPIGAEIKVPEVGPSIGPEHE